MCFHSGGIIARRACARKARPEELGGRESKSAGRIPGRGPSKSSCAVCSFLPVLNRLRLKGAAVRLHRGSCLLGGLFTTCGQRSSCLGILSRLLPFSAPGLQHRLKLGPRNFRYFSGDARFILGDEIVALRDAHLIAGGCCRCRCRG